MKKFIFVLISFLFISISVSAKIYSSVPKKFEGRYYIWAQTEEVNQDLIDEEVPYFWFRLHNKRRLDFRTGKTFIVSKVTVKELDGDKMYILQGYPFNLFYVIQPTNKKHFFNMMVLKRINGKMTLMKKLLVRLGRKPNRS